MRIQFGTPLQRYIRYYKVMVSFLKCHVQSENLVVAYFHILAFFLQQDLTRIGLDFSHAAQPLKGQCGAVDRAWAVDKMDLIPAMLQQLATCDL